MKRRVLKKWFEVSLYIIEALLIILLCAEHENIFYDLFKNLICITLFGFIGFILNKYGRSLNNE